MKKLLILLPILLLALTACGPKIRDAGGQMDTPETHYEIGTRYYNDGDFVKAESEFKLAIELDPKFAPAYAGLALTDGEKAKNLEGKERKKAFKIAFKNLDKSFDYDSKLIAAWIAKGMLITIRDAGSKDEDWWEDAVECFDKVLKKFDDKNSEAHFRKGNTLKLAYKFRDAGNEFRIVLDLNKEFTEKANKQWKVVQDIERAAPGSRIGKRIALIEKLSRADICALFISELDVARMINKRRPASFNTEFVAPTDSKTMETEITTKVVAITDIENHWAKNFIDDVVKLQLRGLEPYANHTFKPQDLITRGEYAFILEDVLIAIIGDPKLASLHIGSDKSRFADVNLSAPYYNAICNAVDKNIMDAYNMMEFGALKSVSGPDALLAIRKLKELKKF